MGKQFTPFDTAKRACALLGLTLSATEGGYQVKYKGGFGIAHTTPYTTDNLADALTTARTMAATRYQTRRAQ